MAEQLVSDLGLLGLFVAALLAASFLPFPVEAVVPVMVAQGYSPLAIVVAGTAGGYLGSLVNYRIASRGELWWRERNPRRTRTLDRIEAMFARRGAPLLFFSWVPFFGEVLTVVGGLAHVRLSVFSFWTVLGRAVRMVALVGLSSLVL